MSLAPVKKKFKLYPEAAKALLSEYFPNFTELWRAHFGGDIEDEGLLRDIEHRGTNVSLFINARKKNAGAHSKKEVQFVQYLVGGKPFGQVSAMPKSSINDSGIKQRSEIFHLTKDALSDVFEDEGFQQWIAGGEMINASLRDSEKLMSCIEKNRILYGPPGTGKTYETIYAALQILDPASAASYKQVVEDDEASQDERLAARAKLKASFDKLSNEQRVRFVTFHQSFSYEDFVEGLRAETDDATGQIHYEVVDGIFKAICSDAKSGGRLVSVFDQAMERLQEKLEASDGRLSLKTVRGNAFEVAYDGGKTFRVFPKSTEVDDPYYVASIENVRKLFAGEPKKGMYNTSYVEGMLRYLQAECGLPAKFVLTEQSVELKPYVLIIDEINRGNISRIFGELITLIEPSKRAGAEEALSVTLPYSKEPFSVPDNVYIIGTMNTADRSLAGLDLALRRRFAFTEMPPHPELLKSIKIKGVEDLDLAEMLAKMNQRISVLLDRDHTLGHAYFMPLQKKDSTPAKLTELADIFRQKILPLLQEYFFEDWERIRWVLNDQNKSQKPEVAEAFIIEDKTLDLSGLFKGVHDKLRQSPQWKLNPKAFDNPTAYRGIAANLAETAPSQPAASEATG